MYIYIHVWSVCVHLSLQCPAPPLSVSRSPSLSLSLHSPFSQALSARLPLTPPNTRLVHPASPPSRPHDAQEVKEWIREDEFGNIVARGIVGEDDPYEDRVGNAPVKKEEEAKHPEVEGATTNRWGWRGIRLCCF